MIRELTPEETSSTEFAHLLWLAVEVDNDELTRILHDDLTNLSVVGAIDEAHVIAFAAFNSAVDPVVIEYIAVDEREQNRGYGAALVDAIRKTAPGRAIYAETDDDAVEFYRRLGFTVNDKDAPDPRWPDRQRYECVLVDP